MWAQAIIISMKELQLYAVSPSWTNNARRGQSRIGIQHRAWRFNTKSVPPPCFPGEVLTDRLATTILPIIKTRTPLKTPYVFLIKIFCYCKCPCPGYVKFAQKKPMAIWNGVQPVLRIVCQKTNTKRTPRHLNLSHTSLLPFSQKQQKELLP